MKKSADRLTRDQQKEIAGLERLPDDQIDTTEVPEILDWSTAQRGALYRPVKQQITLRLDADIVAWFKRHARGGRGYQTDINRALRSFIMSSVSNEVVPRESLDFFRPDYDHQWFSTGDLPEHEVTALAFLVKDNATVGEPNDELSEAVVEETILPLTSHVPIKVTCSLCI